ncbi:CinA family protein [Nitratiruptor tergarcus]|uniref:Nicotinamide-nucleotide amidase n=1 Tax=Nitratiruptor tergarcus DSM 16512 TaxID=1069081 RepID=A0A1W1WUX6_9BACT|nr:CinA family protein [Nitratiruptor tergarcus]SMC09992.1 nicotinamide-nucleotide amidase [Nitratiruptor tergarcus DSM 16512]
MKNIILYVGKEFLINTELVSYIKREALKKIECINAELYLAEKDKNLFLKISKALEEYDKTLIVTTPQSYATTSKIIATIFEDNLIANEEMLVPSKAKIVEKNSFLLTFADKSLNLIKAESCSKLPKILLESQKETALFYIFDMPKEEIVEKLLPLAKSYDIDFILSQESINLYKLFAYNKRFGDIAMFVQNAKLLIPQNLVVTTNIFEYLIERLSALHKTITFAESCTGGLLASLLTKVPGSSNIFNGSLVTYANEIKNAWLGVKQETLQAFGAVSEETVEEMLKGAMRVAQADFAIAISGIAGPGGATETKPVGTVVVGCKSASHEIIRTLYFKGDRNYIQYQAAMYGIKLLFEIAKDELF